MTASRVECLIQILAYRLSQGETIILPAPNGTTITIDQYTVLPDPLPENMAPEVTAMLDHVQTARHQALSPPTGSEVRNLAHGTCPKCRGTCGRYEGETWIRCLRCQGQGTVILL